MDARYWLTAAASFARHLKDPRFVLAVARSGLIADEVPLDLPTYYLAHVYPEIARVDVDMPETTWRINNLDPLERFTLLAFVKMRSPKRIFEIGTYDGQTTLALARAAPDAEVFTIDLPPSKSDVSTEPHTRAHAGRGGVGSAFAGTIHAERITQLFGDSTTFDFSPWAGTIDLVLVDAGHEYRFARSDTLSALGLVSPRGVIAYDDYQRDWPGVVRAVHELPPHALERTFCVAGTGLAITDFGAQ